jgi:hypothetical protein
MITGTVLFFKIKLPIGPTEVFFGQLIFMGIKSNGESINQSTIPKNDRGGKDAFFQFGISLIHPLKFDSSIHVRFMLPFCPVSLQYVTHYRGF